MVRDDFELQKPTMRDSRPAQVLAKARLEDMGSMSHNELIMAVACSLTITLWILGGLLGQSFHQISLFEGTWSAHKFQYSMLLKPCHNLVGVKA